MAQVTITINAREYAVACEDGQEARLLQLAEVLDEKARMITQGTGQVNENMLLAMVGLLLADELVELKKSVVSERPKPEGVNIERLLEIDKAQAEKINSLRNEIISVANSIKLL